MNAIDELLRLRSPITIYMTKAVGESDKARVSVGGWAPDSKYERPLEAYGVTVEQAAAKLVVKLKEGKS